MNCFSSPWREHLNNLFYLFIYFGMKKEKMNPDFMQHMTDRLNLPRDLMLQESLVYITGQKEMTVENYKGILKYETDFICLSLNHGRLQITGRHLCIDYYTNDNMKISGFIEKIEYSM